MNLTHGNNDAKTRLQALRRLLELGEISTQEDLVKELKNQRFDVTQSTISRDLRRLGAVRATDNTGRTIYRLPNDTNVSVYPMVTGSLRELVINIEHNGALVVIHTTPGSASLIARHLDQTKPEGILGTIAGDDTIFVAPASTTRITETIKAIVDELS